MTAKTMTIQDYYMGRDLAYGDELTSAKMINAGVTVQRLNALLLAVQADGVAVHINPKTGTLLTSGWRPKKINANTPGAAPHSLHMECQAGDLYDPDGEIDEWCLAHLEVMEKIGLWQEHPASTKGWFHGQTIPPKSGNRVFYP